MSILLFFVPILLAAPAASSGNTESKEREARMACLEGDPTRGVSLLSELFVDTKLPNYLFNQGRCYQQNRRYEDALARFEEYLRVGKNLTTIEKSDTEGHIADCERRLAKQRGQDMTAQVPSTSQTIPPPPTMPPMVVETATAQDNPGRGLRIGGLATITLGIVTLGTGAYFNIKERELADEMRQDIAKSTPANHDQLKDYKLFSKVGYFAGGATVATGLTLYLIGLSRQRDKANSNQVAIVPRFYPGEATLTFQGEF